MIHLENVTKLYGSVMGVNDVTMSLAANAYGLIGPNGSGKSTLLNLITGQLRPTLGSLSVLGCDPWNNREMFRRIGVCPERDLLYHDVTGFDWVRYLLELNGYGRAEAAKRAGQALDQLGLSEAMRRRMGGYSRGMRQRTKLAQALAHEPELLILDEPFNGLDPLGRHAMTEVLRQWVRDGKGLLLASHILHEVEAVTDSFLMICSGRLLASGSAEEVHALLADVPAEIHIRCQGAARLARQAVEEELVQAVRFTDGDEGLVLSTRSPAAVYARLPQWTDDTNVRIHELRSSGESLETLFGSLLRIHRGGS
ncbi:MAG TPA: ABC transporter ATP-binding protein [Thermoguttaceae bacterium]|nr:ABC transporter ATP-binding protein [Thermoguttaceae bacterium]